MGEVHFPGYDSELRMDTMYARSARYFAPGGSLRSMGPLWTVLLALETGRSFQHTRQYDRSGHLDSYLTWLHELASSVLLGLARLQGRVVNDANEEQPGWIRSHRIEQEWFLADYFQACNTQAWTAAAVLYFTSMLLDG
jgi:hypothetical protein